MMYAVMRTHHLLDHKPDNLLRTGHKYKLQGVYKFGTPGIAVVFTEHVEFLENFVDALKSNMPQKKFEIPIRVDDWKSTSDSGGGVSLPKGQGYQEMATAADLKQALTSFGLPDNDYYTILGLDPPSDTADTDAFKGGKKRKSKGKKKR